MLIEGNEKCIEIGSNYHLTKLIYSQYRPQALCILGALKKFAKLTGKHLCWSLFYVKLRSQKALLKWSLWLRYFPEHFAKSLRKTFSQNGSGQHLLSYHVRVSEWIHTQRLLECQGTPYSKQAPYLAATRFEPSIT